MAVSTLHTSSTPAPGPHPRSGVSEDDTQAGAVGAGTPRVRLPDPLPLLEPHPCAHATGQATEPRCRPGEPTPLGKRQISHDIHHELGTITMLASLLSSAPDVGAESRERARQILGEIRWLDELHRAYEELTEDPGAPAPLRPRVPSRLDTLAADVVAATRLSSLTRITFSATETWAHTDRLAYWRALRNVIGNAIRAAGAGGTVAVQVSVDQGWAVTQVDDDGPGLGQAPPGLGSLGLGIVQDLASARGGQLEIRSGGLGGCCVRLLLPACLTGPAG